MEDEVEEIPKSERKALNSWIKGFKGIASGGKRIAGEADLIKKAGTLMGRSIRYSQDALKYYWDEKEMRIKENADFPKALEVVDRGIAMMNEASIIFPTITGAILPAKQKMMAQRFFLQCHMAGTAITFEEAMKTIEEQMKVAAKV
jgi:hypothetical protein